MCKSNNVYGGDSSKDHNLKYNITFRMTNKIKTVNTIVVATSELKIPPEEIFILLAAPTKVIS